MSASLRSLSDHEILSRTQALTHHERKVTLSVLLYLNEVERRQLHLKLGHGTLFDYCTNGLGYSASAAMRRIQAARCITRFPDVYDLLVSNELNLSTVCMVAKVLTAENQAELLARARAKSQREVEAVCAEFEPLDAVPRERVRTVVVRVPARALTASGTHDVLHLLAGVASKNTPPETAGCHGDENAAAESPVRVETALQRRVAIQFSADEAFMAKVERVRSIAWHRLPVNASFEQLFDLALDYFIKHEDPEKRHERREAKKVKPTVSRSRGDGARHISANVRDEVYVRDQGRCTFVGASEKRCASTHALQIDHIQPVARGGPGTPDNLRLLCAQHNRLEAERVLGSSGRRVEG